MFKRWLTLVAIVIAALVAPGGAAAAKPCLTPQARSSLSPAVTGSAMGGVGRVVVSAVRVAASGAKQVVATVRSPGGGWGPMQVIDSTSPDGLAFLRWVGA